MNRIATLRLALALGAAIAACAPSLAGGADTQLARVKGSVGYAEDSASPLQPIVTSLVLPDNALAVTQSSSAALVTMPDSSEITVGERAKVKIGAFKSAVAGPGSTILIDHGAVQFSIKHPAGGKSNYVFTTNTSQVAIRGTDGYISSDSHEDVVSVTHAGSANDVEVKAGGKTYHVAAGKTLRIKKKHNRVMGAAMVAGISHPAYKQFAGLHKPAPSAAKPAQAAGGAVHHEAAASAHKKKHH